MEKSLYVIYFALTIMFINKENKQSIRFHFSTNFFSFELQISTPAC
jgi:hypothetical protein